MQRSEGWLHEQPNPKYYMSIGLRTWPPVTVATAGVRVQLFTIATLVAKVAAIRIEADRNNGAGAIFVGDSTVSSSQYTARLLVGDSISIEGSAVDPTRIWIDTDTNGSKAQVSTLF